MVEKKVDDDNEAMTTKEKDNNTGREWRRQCWRLEKKENETWSEWLYLMLIGKRRRGRKRGGI